MRSQEIILSLSYWFSIFCCFLSNLGYSHQWFWPFDHPFSVSKWYFLVNFIIIPFVVLMLLYCSVLSLWQSVTFQEFDCIRFIIRINPNFVLLLRTILHHHCINWIVLGTWNCSQMFPMVLIFHSYILKRRGVVPLGNWWNTVVKVFHSKYNCVEILEMWL